MEVHELQDDKWYTLQLQGNQTLSGSGKEFKAYVEWAENITKEQDHILIWGDKTKPTDNGTPGTV